MRMNRGAPAIGATVTLIVVIALLVGSFGHRRTAQRSGASAPSTTGSVHSMTAHEAKQAQQESAITAARNAAASDPVTKPTGSEFLTPVVNEPPNPHTLPTQGIQAQHEPFFSSSGFDASNFYQGPVGNSWYLVWAGAVSDGSGSPSGPGAVRIFAGDVSTDSVPSYLGTFDDPSATGQLTIVSYSGTDLSLVDSAGNSATFDLASLTFN